MCIDYMFPMIEIVGPTEVEQARFWSRFALIKCIYMTQWTKKQDPLIQQIDPFRNINTLVDPRSIWINLFKSALQHCPSHYNPPPRSVSSTSSNNIVSAAHHHRHHCLPLPKSTLTIQHTQVFGLVRRVGVGWHCCKVGSGETMGV